MVLRIYHSIAGLDSASLFHTMKAEPVIPLRTEMILLRSNY